jgi:sugar/nucleoside kinase (ribokinase family)
MEKKNDILVIGSVAFDAIETPFGKTDKIIGGAATYISIAASYLNKSGKTYLVGVVGEDFPEEGIEMFHSKGIDTRGLEIKEGGKTFFWSGKYHNDMNSRDTLVTELNVLADFDPILPDDYRQCPFIMLGNLEPRIQRSVILQMEVKPKLIALDTMDFWINSAREDLLETLKLVDVLSINDEEARLLSGEYSLVKASKKILKMGPKILVIKKGEHGALLFNDRQVYFAPALPLEDVFDPTGAGDTFAGGFIGFLANSGEINFEEMKRAILFGSALASFCVEKFGLERLENLSSSDISERIREFIDLVQIDMEFV